MLVLLTSVILLVTGSNLLTIPLLNEPPLPLGTLSTWAGIIVLPSIIFYSIRGFHPPRGEFMKVFRTINIIIIYLSSCWGFVSYFLAGNWSFSFSGHAEGFTGSDRAYLVFQQYTVFSIVLPLVFLIIFLASSILQSKFSR